MPDWRSSGVGALDSCVPGNENYSTDVGPNSFCLEFKTHWASGSARNCGAVQVELVCLQNTAQSGPHFGARNVGRKRGAAEAARYPS